MRGSATQLTTTISARAASTDSRSGRMKGTPTAAARIRLSASSARLETPTMDSRGLSASTYWSAQ